MGYPRRLYVPPDTRGVYHCVSRCVRRAFLCGFDPLTGRSFEHRKQWIEDRILELAEIFAVAVHAYAVMSNHVHVVLEVDPMAPASWSDDEVARRWASLSPGGRASGFRMELRARALLSQPDRLDTVRKRLGNLSWYMRYLNEPIARRANREDECTGRFWEGRFRCQALLDDSAVLACMVYVDLNPVRAGISKTPTGSRHTSVCSRMRAGTPAQNPVTPVASSIRSDLVPLTTDQYITLVDWTGRRLRSKSLDTDPAEIPSILSRLGMNTRQWLIQVPATESHYWRAIGTFRSLVERAEAAGLRWLHGTGTARKIAEVGIAREGIAQ